MESLVYNKENLCWCFESEEESVAHRKIDIGYYLDLLNLKARTNSCCLIINYSIPCIEFCCSQVKELLGFRTKDVTLSHILRIIHPDDAFKYIPEQFRIVQMLKQLPEHKRREFKISRTLRLKHSSGKYVPVLQQLVVIHGPNVDNMLRVFVGLSKADEDEEKQCGKISDIKINTERSNVENGNYEDQKTGHLTRREKEVLELIAKNMSTKEIAEKLSRSPHTVKNHRKNMLRKTGTSNSLELVMLAIQNKWV